MVSPAAEIIQGVCQNKSSFIIIFFQFLAPYFSFWISNFVLLSQIPLMISITGETVCMVLNFFILVCYLYGMLPLFWYVTFW